MNDYYLLRTGKDITAQRMAEAERTRLARTVPAEGGSRPSHPRTQVSSPRFALGSLLHRVAFL